MVAADMQRRILARRTLPPRYLAATPLASILELTRSRSDVVKIVFDSRFISSPTFAFKSYGRSRLTPALPRPARNTAESLRRFNIRAGDHVRSRHTTKTRGPDHRRGTHRRGGRETILRGRPARGGPRTRRLAGLLQGPCESS